jgi:hypothetical protein
MWSNKMENDSDSDSDYDPDDSNDEPFDDLAAETKEATNTPRLCKSAQEYSIASTSNPTSRQHPGVGVERLPALRKQYCRPL